MKESSFASAVRLIEDALVLAKRADATAWLVYLAGVVPFFGFLLYEITDLAQNPFALDRLVGTAFVAAVLYCWLHIGQSVFCGCLRATLTETAPALRACFAEAAAAQPILAAGKLMIWPVTLLLVVPHPAVTMFFQHSLVPSASRPQGVRSVMAESRRNALYRSWQAIWMLLLVLLLRAILWVNLFGLLVMAPALWKSFTGMEGRLTRSPDLLLNPTSLAALAMLAYIGLDPPVKAACVLRQFTRGAEESGLDLRLRLATLRRAAAAAALMLWTLVVLTLCLPRHATAAAPQAVSRSASVAPEQMGQAIKQVFRDPRNAWDLPVVKPRHAPSGPFTAFIDSIVTHISEAWKSVLAGIDSLIDALRHILENSNEPPERQAHAVSSRSGWTVIAVFTVLLAAAMLVGLWNRRERKSRQMAAITAIPAQSIDIAREDLQAIDQPEDEWIRLARQHQAAGNLRFAVRALYLSTLAAFGRCGLLALARGKTNLDYLRELQRRAKRLNDGLVPLFRSNLKLFEESWYGEHPVSIERYELFERNASALRQLL